MDIGARLGSMIEAAGLAGAVALVGNRSGTCFIQSYGARDIAIAAPLADDSIFQLFSMTKAITSVAAMQLVERGLLSLDAPIGEILPELANPMVVDGFDESGVAILRPAKRPITLRNLLTHTSGFGYDFCNIDMQRARGPGGPPPPGSRAGIVSPLLFDPGTRWEYGISTDWVGMAIEAASNKSLDEFMAESIFKPLGMIDTGFTLSQNQRARQATLYARQKNGALLPFPADVGGAPEFHSGGGGLLGTGGDYMRFLRMILNGGTLDDVCILSAQSIAEISRNQIGRLRAGAIASIAPKFSHNMEWFPEMTPGWGLGFMINPQKGPNGRAAGSLAWAGIANSYYWVDPASDVIGILLSQFLPFGDPQMLNVLGAFETLVYAQRSPISKMS